MVPTTESYMRTYCSFLPKRGTLHVSTAILRSRVIARNERENSNCITLNTSAYTAMYTQHAHAPNKPVLAFFPPTAANTPHSQHRAQIIHPARQLHARRVPDRAARSGLRRMGFQRVGQVRRAQEHELRKRCAACPTWAGGRAEDDCQHEFL